MCNDDAGPGAVEARESDGYAPDAWPARRDGRCCATCGGALADDAEVWVRNTRYRDAWGYPNDTIAPHCTTCTAHRQRYGVRPARFRPPVPCAGCGRTVHLAYDRMTRHVVVCSERCRLIARNAARRDQRQADRPRRCSSCGQAFVGRRDARACSPACRQRVYRQRHSGPQPPRVDTCRGRTCDRR